MRTVQKATMRSPKAPESGHLHDRPLIFVTVASHPRLVRDICTMVLCFPRLFSNLPHFIMWIRAVFQKCGPMALTAYHIVIIPYPQDLEGERLVVSVTGFLVSGWV